MRTLLKMLAAVTTVLLLALVAKLHAGDIAQDWSAFPTAPPAAKSTAGDTTPKRATEIEKRFGFQYVKTDSMIVPGIGSYKYWLFKASCALRIQTIGVPIPVGADDRQVAICVTSAMYGAGWYEAVLEQIIADQKKKEQTQPSPVPQLQ